MKETKLDFTEIVQPDGYALETLINGNPSHCIEYLQDLILTGITGIGHVHDELNIIKENAPNDYEFIRRRVFGTMPLFSIKLFQETLKEDRAKYSKGN